MAADPKAPDPKAAAEKPKAKPSPALRITARVDGFRRAGLAHPAAPVEHKAGAFSAEQLEQLRGEPNLIVEDI